MLDIGCGWTSIIINLMHYEGLHQLNSDAQSRWIRKYIFSRGYLPSLSEIFDASKYFPLNLIDVDDWRIHYYRTLKEWKKRFCKVKDIVIKTFGEEFFRMWDLYLTSSAVSFYTASNHLFQIVYSKGVVNEYPVIKRIL